MKGCPRHPKFDRSCVDVRCQRCWTVEGAPTPDEQLALWVDGFPTCPNSNHECCPDFSCCNARLLWPKASREKYVAAGSREREKMLMTGLSALIDAKTYVTRGVKEDHE